MLKKSCPECGSLIELDETGYSQGTTVNAQCQLCGTEVEFFIPTYKSQQSQDSTEIENLETIDEAPRSIGMNDSVPGKQDNGNCSPSITTSQILSEDDTDEENEWQPNKYHRLSYWWWAAIPVCIIVIIFFSLRRTPDSSHENVILSENDTVVPVVKEELIEEIPVNKSSDDVYHYDGEYLIFGLAGRAQFSYRTIEDSKIIDGPFRFNEGLYEDDGTFNGMGSGVAIVTGNFKDGLQDGKWSIGTGHSEYTLTFQDGYLNGPVCFSSSWGPESSIVSGTIKDRKFIGEFSYIQSYYDGERENELNSIRGRFNSIGIPVGQWKEKTKDGESYFYIMDEKTSNETGVQGRFDGVSSVESSLDLSEYMLQLNSYIISNKAKLENQAKKYNTYWKD